MNRQSYINGFKRPAYFKKPVKLDEMTDQVMNQTNNPTIGRFVNEALREIGDIRDYDYVTSINNPIRQESPAAMIRRIANESLREIGATPINNESIPAGKLLEAFNLQERTQFFLNQGLDQSQIDVANSSYLRNNPIGRNQHE